MRRQAVLLPLLLSLAVQAEAAGPGAPVPFATIEAETARTNAALIGPDRRFGTLAAEASDRQAVRLERPGDWVEFTLPSPANALTIRYAIPDSPDGRGSDAGIALDVNGAPAAGVPITSRYNWYYGTYPFTNQPRDGGAHHFYDHARLLLHRTLPARTRIRLRLEAPAPDWIALDLLDVELAPPPKQAPPGSVSVLALGADPTGRRSSARAFQRALDKGGTVWIPPGEYRIDRHLVPNDVTLAGAGHWHSVLRGKGLGIYGRKSRNVVLKDFAIIGEVAERKDKEKLAGIGGDFSDSTISDLWIQHTKVGIWVDGPLDRLTVSRVRIYDQAADGVNFHGGVTNSVVEDSFVRGSGDDGLAMWSHRIENRGNAFRRNTVIAPTLANGIAIYGGRDIAVEDNLVTDTLTQGGGIHLGARFDATPFAGDILVKGNTIIRGGVFDPNWKFGVGAFWIYALDRPIDGARIHIEGMKLVDSSYPAIHFIGKPIEGVHFEDLDIDGAGTAALQIQAAGEASFRNVTARGLGRAGVDAAGPDFRIVDLGGNSGWETKAAFAPPPEPAKAD